MSLNIWGLSPASYGCMRSTLKTKSRPPGAASRSIAQQLKLMLGQWAKAARQKHPSGRLNGLELVCHEDVDVTRTRVYRSWVLRLEQQRHPAASHDIVQPARVQDAYARQEQTPACIIQVDEGQRRVLWLG